MVYPFRKGDTVSFHPQGGDEQIVHGVDPGGELFQVAPHGDPDPANNAMWYHGSHLYPAVPPSEPPYDSGGQDEDIEQFAKQVNGPGTQFNKQYLDEHSHDPRTDHIEMSDVFHQGKWWSLSDLNGDEAELRQSPEVHYNVHGDEVYGDPSYIKVPWNDLLAENPHLGKDISGHPYQTPEPISKTPVYHGGELHYNTSQALDELTGPHGESYLNNPKTGEGKWVNNSEIHTDPNHIFPNQEHEPGKAVWYKGDPHTVTGFIPSTWHSGRYNLETPAGDQILAKTDEVKGDPNYSHPYQQYPTGSLVHLKNGQGSGQVKYFDPDWNNYSLHGHDQPVHGSDITDVQYDPGNYKQEQMKFPKNPSVSGEGEICPNCMGQGEKPGYSGTMQACKECNGTGEIHDECPYCQGEGERTDDYGAHVTCKKCGGTGERFKGDQSVHQGAHGPITVNESEWSEKGGHHDDDLTARRHSLGGAYNWRRPLAYHPGLRRLYVGPTGMIHGDMGDLYGIPVQEGEYVEDDPGTYKSQKGWHVGYINHPNSNMGWYADGDMFTVPANHQELAATMGLPSKHTGEVAPQDLSAEVDALPDDLDLDDFLNEF